jgi:hypothetical protein
MNINRPQLTIEPGYLFLSPGVSTSVSSGDRIENPILKWEKYIILDR